MHTRNFKATAYISEGFKELTYQTQAVHLDDPPLLNLTTFLPLIAMLHGKTVSVRGCELKTALSHYLRDSDLT